MRIPANTPTTINRTHAHRVSVHVSYATADRYIAARATATMPQVSNITHAYHQMARANTGANARKAVNVPKAVSVQRSVASVQTHPKQVPSVPTATHSPNATAASIRSANR